MQLVNLASVFDALFAILPFVALGAKPQGLLPVALKVEPVNTTQGEAEQHVEDSDEDAEGITFCFSSHFLLQCWRFLMTIPEEQLILIAGMKLGDGCRVANSFCRVEYTTSSSCGVAADPRSTHACLREMDAFGHQLVAVFHSHPGCGVEGVTPSETDHAAQKRYQSIGYEAISGIFSRDGYVRFFSERGLDFKIEIQGLGIEEVEENAFRLDIKKEGSPVQTTGVS